MPDESPGRIADLIGHRVELALYCGCTALKVARAEYLLEQLGPEATIADAERRMICQKCRQRPRIKLGYQWGGGVRDRRKNPPPLPKWVRKMMGAADGQL